MSIQVTFRTLKGGTFKLPAQQTDTILQVKKKVAEQQNVDDYSAYRLIYKGKILPDNATIASAGISTAGFIVVMPPKKIVAKPLTKPSTLPTPASNTAPATASSPANKPTDLSRDAPPAVSNDPSPPPDTSAAEPAPPAAPASASPTDPSSALVTGETYDQSVQQICAMGFPEHEVKKALQAAFNNPDRAVEFLCNGMPIPAPAEEAAPSTTPRATQTTAAPGTPFNMFEAPVGGPDDAAGRGSLDFLRSIPQFNNMRRLIRANPNVLQQMLQQLEQSNPDLLQIIDANQAEFTRLINEPIGDGDAAGDEVTEQIAQGLAGAGGLGGTVRRGNELYVTPEDHEKINRLTELAATIGLEQAHVLQTWIVCNGDETLAANYLMDHAEELRADILEEEEANQQDAPGSGDGGPPV